MVVAVIDGSIVDDDVGDDVLVASENDLDDDVKGVLVSRCAAVACFCCCC